MQPLLGLFVCVGFVVVAVGLWVFGFEASGTAASPPPWTVVFPVSPVPPAERQSIGTEALSVITCVHT